MIQPGNLEPEEEMLQPGNLEPEEDDESVLSITNPASIARAYTDGQTVNEIIQALVAQYPGMKRGTITRKVMTAVQGLTPPAPEPAAAHAQNGVAHAPIPAVAPANEPPVSPDADDDDDDDDDDFELDPNLFGGIAPAANDDFEPDPNLALPSGSSGNAPKMKTDGAADGPARGSTPPDGHSLLDQDTYLQVQGGIEAVQTLLDDTGAVVFSDDQAGWIAGRWRQITNRLTAMGVVVEE
jgi:hypothetical protein